MCALGLFCAAAPSLQGKTNFFEKRVGEYSKMGVGSETEEKGTGAGGLTFDNEDF